MSTKTSWSQHATSDEWAQSNVEVLDSGGFLSLKYGVFQSTRRGEMVWSTGVLIRTVTKKWRRQGQCGGEEVWAREALRWVGDFSVVGSGCWVVGGRVLRDRRGIGMGRENEAWIGLIIAFKGLVTPYGGRGARVWLATQRRGFFAWREGLPCFGPLTMTFSQTKISPNDLVGCLDQLLQNSTVQYSTSKYIPSFMTD